MGRKEKWFDTVQKILSSSEPDPVETEAKKAAKSSLKKLWQFAKTSNASTSTAPGAHQQQPPPPPPPSLSRPADQKQGQVVIAEAQSLDAWREQGDHACPAEEVSEQAAAGTVAGPTDTTPRALPAPSKEDIAAARIQAACRGYLARRAHRERGIARLMSLVEGLAVKRQTEEALYCMQTMTRVQTQIYSRRLKTEEDKKALKSQIKIKRSFDKAKIAEGWDHGHQSKEQMEALLTMKQEAASRRQRTLAYAFSHQWRNRNPSSARAAPPPMFMDPGNPNWGWTWTERWMAAARPWETQTTASGNSRATAKSAGGRPRLAVISVEPPSTPGGRSFRPPNWPSLPSPSTPPLRSPSVSGRTVVSASPRSSKLHAAGGLQPDRRPRSSQQERAVAVGSPRCVVPASPRRSGSPLHASGSGLQRATSMQLERRPRSSQERAASSPRHAGSTATLLRTTSLRSEPPRRLSVGGAVPAASTVENVGAPVTPRYMQPTTSVRAKARGTSPSPSSSPSMPDTPESAPAPLQATSPSSAKKRLSLGIADKPSQSTP